MKISFHLLIVAAAMLGCCSGARASGDVPGHPGARTAMLPVRGAVEVKQVKGSVAYAYDGTGWRMLAEGKLLHAGATIRASASSEAILKVDRSALVRVSPVTALHLTAAAPEEELPKPMLAGHSKP
jgi:hypothetical protein